MAFIVAGTHSGVGKTTITLAILAVCRSTGMHVQSFKVGPDYIDPMFHREMTGQPCRNLDPILTSPNYVLSHFHRYSSGKNAVIVEGVMGLFDGINGAGAGSTAEVAKLLNLPVLLVIDCAQLSQSIGALLYGYLHFDLDINIVGVVLNRVGSDRHRQFLEEAVAQLAVPVWGVCDRQENLQLPSRHLGLVPVGELSSTSRLYDGLCDFGKRCFDWQKITPYLPPPESLACSRNALQPILPRPRIALACDRAFNFYYPENLEILVEAGAELVPWSPMGDRFPENIHGMYFGGGFPEVFAEDLAANQLALESVRKYAHLPIYAECGGLIYLSDSLILKDNRQFPLVGIIPTIIQMGKRLVLGYRRLETNHTWFGIERELWGHEFHYSIANNSALQSLYQVWDGRGQALGQSGWHRSAIVASYMHLHWGDKPTIPQAFVKSCALMIDSGSFF